MHYPRVLSEFETLQAAIHGQSLARFGDGELRIATGGAAKSQTADPALRRELESMLLAPRNCLVCIPPPDSAKPQFWQHYAARKYLTLYRGVEYGSAFITRPDSAPWIDTPDYWACVRSLWAGKDVVLVAGDRKSLTAEMLCDARSVRAIACPSINAYAQIDGIQESIGKPSGPVILCLGATATALSFRLAQNGIHALDLGHIGMFMRHAGSFNIARSSLISKSMLEANRELHARPEGFGGDGKKHAERVLAFAQKLNAQSLLDYGCGQGTLKTSLRASGFKPYIGEYDPAVSGKDVPPKPAELVVCTDVLEHIEPDLLDNVLRHIVGLASKGVFLCIATRPANKKLPDGRNAHLIVQSADWWADHIRGVCDLEGLALEEKRKGDGSAHEVRLWLRK